MTDPTIKKPRSVKIFLGIEWFRIFEILFLLIFVCVAPALTTLSGTLRQIVDGVAEVIGVEDVAALAENHARLIGYTIGILIIPTLLLSAALLGVRYRRLWLSRSAVVLQFLVAAGNAMQGTGNGWRVDLIAAVMTFRASFKNYLTTPRPPDQ